MNLATRKPLPVLNALREAHLRQRVGHERMRRQEGAIEHGAGASGDINIPGLQHFERDQRRVQQVAQLVGEQPEAFGSACRLAIAARRTSLTCVLGHRARDRIVAASVQRAILVGTDRCAQFNREGRWGVKSTAPPSSPDSGG
jgi:hypothetical protein